MSASDLLRISRFRGTMRNMYKTKAHIFGMLIGALALGSCSYSYTVRATIIDGRLAFIVDSSSNRRPTCVNGITVSVDKGEPARAKAIAGDTEGLVKVGVFWWESMEHDCENSFPIFYGQALKGKRLVYPDDFSFAEKRGKTASHVDPKPLKRDVVYEVSTVSGATGYGRGYFRITADGLV